MTAKAAAVGFDWQQAGQVLEKLAEELRELDEARRRGIQEEIKEEIGDLLFVLVNLARLLKVDAEQALREANVKFRSRFGYLEKKLNEQGRSLDEATLEEMDRFWDEAKKQE